MLPVPLYLLQFVLCSAIQSLSFGVHYLASPFSFTHLSLWCLGVKEYVLCEKKKKTYYRKKMYCMEKTKRMGSSEAFFDFFNKVIQG